MKKLSYYIREIILPNGTTSNTATVVPNETKTYDDIIKLLIEKHPQYTYHQAEELLLCYFNTVNEQVLSGYSIETIFGKVKYSIAGEFENTKDHFDGNRQKARGHLTLNTQIKESIAKIKFEKIAQPILGPKINSVVDGINQNAAPNTIAVSSLIKLGGTNMKVMKNDEGTSINEGVYLINTEGIRFKCSTLVTNTPTEVIALVPQNIEPGEYRVAVCTFLYSNHIYKASMECIATQTISVVSSAEMLCINNNS